METTELISTFIHLTQQAALLLICMFAWVCIGAFLQGFIPALYHRYRINRLIRRK